MYNGKPHWKWIMERYTQHTHFYTFKSVPETQALFYFYCWFYWYFSPSSIIIMSLSFFFCFYRKTLEKCHSTWTVLLLINSSYKTVLANNILLAEQQSLVLVPDELLHHVSLCRYHLQYENKTCESQSKGVIIVFAWWAWYTCSHRVYMLLSHTVYLALNAI